MTKAEKVGRLGADSIATVGLTEALLSLVMAISFGLSLPPQRWLLAASPPHKS